MFLGHQGVCVYHVYKNDMATNGPMTYWFTINPNGGECDEGTFDVRNLPDFSGDESIEWTIKKAIENGVIKAFEGDEEFP